jgi:hypothetical protein
MSLQNIIEWSLVFIAFAVVIYTMIVIKEEKNSFLDSAKEKNFHRFKLLIPSWWGATKEKEDHLRFERTDTRYDWYADFIWESEIKEADIIEQMQEKLKGLHLEFDRDTTIIKEPVSFTELSQQGFEVVRVEGTATQDKTERVYCDAFLVRDREHKGTLFALSHASVLNGLIEGPYFEELMLRLKRVQV